MADCGLSVIHERLLNLASCASSSRRNGRRVCLFPLSSGGKRIKKIDFAWKKEGQRRCMMQRRVYVRIAMPDRRLC